MVRQAPAAGCAGEDGWFAKRKGPGVREGGWFANRERWGRGGGQRSLARIPASAGGQKEIRVTTPGVS